MEFTHRKSFLCVALVGLCFLASNLCASAQDSPADAQTNGIVKLRALAWL